MKAQNHAHFPPVPLPRVEVLHYLGYDDDRGGIVSVVRALAGADRFTCVLGVNPGFTQRRRPPLATLEFPGVEGEIIGVRTLWRAGAVARKARDWLRANPARIFHAHSRSGLIVALRLNRAGEKRVIATVHCYGRQRWFYRWAGDQLGDRLFWLSPAMRRYYGAPGEGWTQCIPGCVPTMVSTPSRREPNGFWRLGGVGSLVPWKNWHLVIAALARLPAETRRRIRFSHIGTHDGSAKSRRYAEELRALTACQGLDDIVSWEGEQPSSVALLARIDCLVVASHNEPFSVAMIEALQAGVPVLAASSGGATDIIAPPRNGWFFRDGASEDLARKLALLVERGADVRAVVDPEDLRRFTAPHVATVYAGLYGTLIGS